MYNIWKYFWRKKYRKSVISLTFTQLQVTYHLFKTISFLHKKFPMHLFRNLRKDTWLLLSTHNITTMHPIILFNIIIKNKKLTSVGSTVKLDKSSDGFTFLILDNSNTSIWSMCNNRWDGEDTLLHFSINAMISESSESENHIGGTSGYMLYKRIYE